MISLLYFLLASCFLIGCFANFAGNDYGFELVRAAAAAYALFLWIRFLQLALRIIKMRRNTGLRTDALASDLGLFPDKAVAGSPLVPGVRLAELGLVATGLTGLLLKFYHFPGASLLLVTGFSLAALVFVVSALGNLFGMLKKGTRLLRAHTFLVRLFCGVALFTTLSKFMHWDLSLPGLVAGLGLLLLAVMVWVFRQSSRFCPGEEHKVPAVYNPARTYFVILAAGLLHFLGSILGWVPRFQFLHKPRTMVRMEEQRESREMDSRLQVYYLNTGIFSEIHQSSGQETGQPEPYNLTYHGQ